MPSELQVLHVEDSADDALLMQAELRRGGYAPICRRVETAEEFLTALDERSWDLVIADYSLPHFSAPAALALLKQKEVDLPFIVVSGVLGDEAAVAIMKAGAHDYFRKSRLKLLPTAVQREIREAVNRQQRRLAEEHLREAELRYRTLFEQSPDGVLVIDPETHRAVDFNDRVCQTLGYSRAEFAALRVEDYEARESAQEVQSHVQRALVAGRSDFETRHRTRSGELRDVLVTAQPITLSGRRLLHVIYRDITTMKRGERMLREEEQRYHQLLSSVTNYTYTVRYNNGVPLSTAHSAGCLAVTGYSPADYQADPYLWIRMVHPDDQDLVRQHVAQILTCQEVPPLEHRIIHRNGTLRWIRDTIVERRTDDDHLEGYDGLIEDVTSQKTTECELREREAQLLAARRIQEHLLPARPPKVPGLDIAGAWYPAEFAAGDYYDFLPMRDGGLAIVVADVAGHKFPSALLMASTRAYLRSLSQLHSNTADILNVANVILADEIDEGNFVTLLMAHLNPRTHLLTYSSAGHPTGYVFDRTGRVKNELRSTGMPLGVSPEEHYSTGPAGVLAPGDVLFLLTDGLHDARSPTGELFGIDRCLDSVRAHCRCPAATIIESIRQSLQSFCGGMRLPDDATMVVLRALK
jgi:PAS domain S-box-containing protein